MGSRGSIVCEGWIRDRGGVDYLEGIVGGELEEVVVVVQESEIRGG